MSHGSMQSIMGTRFNIVILKKKKAVSEILWHEITTELKRLDKMLNRFDPESEIAAVNAKAGQYPVVLSDELWNILCDCEIFHKKTCGLFDVTLKNFTNIALHKDEKAVSFLLPHLSLDFGALAKGYALRKIQAILTNAEVKTAFVNFGNSSILAVGHHPYGNSWKVSIENPYRKDEILDEIDLVNISLSTTGNVPFYSGHIVRPDSGRYNDEHKLISVIAENPVTAEVLSTTLMIATNEEKVEILKQFDIEAIRIYNSLL
jgi:thiamine biosynthesis lipoprotein